MSFAEHLNLAVQRLRWELTRTWARLTTLDLLAIALVLLWAGMQWQVIMPLQAQKEALTNAIQHSRDSVAAGRSLPVHTVATPASPEAGFLAFLPPASQRDTLLKTMHDLVTVQGLTLVHADYKVEADPTLPVDKLSLRLSVAGGYVPLRQFLHLALEKMPSLAIDRIDLEKDGKTPDSMTLTLDACLYLRQAGGGKSS